MEVIDYVGMGVKFRDLVKQDEVMYPDRLSEQNLGAEIIDRLVFDSRLVQDKDVFFAIPPLDKSSQGLDHIQEAIEKGARIIIKQANIPTPVVSSDEVIFVDVANARRQKALIARRVHRGQPKVMCAVTGTNGKTSVADFTRQLFQGLGYKAASLGTLGVVTDHDVDDLPPLHHTSPDAFALHETLSKLKKQGFTHVTIEASSHGIDQSRLDGVDFTAAGFTNLSHDHLDYHGTMDVYFDAKKRLFERLLDEGASAVINADTNYFDSLQAVCKARDIHVLPYGKRAENGLQLTNLVIDGAKQIATIAIHHEVHHVEFNFIGKFQVLNALCAMGLVMETGISHLKILPLLSKLRPVPGRLELIGVTKSGGAVYVDYAHTPDALSETLLSLRPYVTGMLTTVFGCGGERDVQKRPIMGKIAGEYSDAQYITDDNPRSEDPAKIRAEIMSACKNATEFNDRKEAITKAIKQLKKNDAVLIAGKGHETSQILDHSIIHFDDREIAASVLNANKGTVHISLVHDASNRSDAYPKPDSEINKKTDRAV